MNGYMICIYTCTYSHLDVLTGHRRHGQTNDNSSQPEPVSGAVSRQYSGGPALLPCRHAVDHRTVEVEDRAACPHLAHIWYERERGRGKEGEGGERGGEGRRERGGGGGGEEMEREGGRGGGGGEMEREGGRGEGEGREG